MYLKTHCKHIISSPRWIIDIPEMQQGNSAHEQEVQLMMAEARNCSNRTCIEYRIQHRNATLKKLEVERELQAVRLKYDMLFNQVTTQGVAATARAAAMGEETFRLPNGELMTVEKFMERTSMLTQTRASLEKSEAKVRRLIDENAALQKERELAANESRRWVVKLLSVYHRNCCIVIFALTGSKYSFPDSRNQGGMKSSRTKCIKKPWKKTRALSTRMKSCNVFWARPKRK